MTEYTYRVSRPDFQQCEMKIFGATFSEPTHVTLIIADNDQKVEYETVEINGHYYMATK